MSEVMVTITKEEYEMLLKANLRLTLIKDHLEERGDHYINDELIRTYAGYKKKEDAGE